jgi:hypothetical protein
MPLDHLLFESLIPGITKAEDKKGTGRTSANLDRGSNETVLLFHRDNEETRRRLKFSGEKCCDFLYFFKNRKRAVLIFIELKGTKINSAAHRIASAYHALAALSEYVKSHTPQALAVIVSSGSAPRREGAVIQKRMKASGIKLYFGKSSKDHPCDIKALIGDLLA